MINFKQSLHITDSKFAKSKILRNNRIIGTTIDDIDETNNLGFLYKKALESLRYSIAEKKDTNEIFYYISLATQSIVGNLLFAADKVSSFKIHLPNGEGKFVNKNNNFDNSYKSDLPTFIEALYLTVITKNNSAIEKIVQIDNSDLPQQPNLVDEFFKPYTKFLRSVLLEDGKAGELLIETYKGVHPDNIKYANYEHLESNHIAHLELWIKLLQGNQKEFNEYLILALEKHKSYWGSNNVMNKGDKIKLKEYPKGFFSIPLTAICILAKKSGMNINVKSDYIPDFFINNQNKEI